MQDYIRDGAVINAFCWQISALSLEFSYVINYTKIDLYLFDQHSLYINDLSPRQSKPSLISKPI